MTQDKREELLALAARCEAASKPSIILDIDIATAVGAIPGGYPVTGGCNWPHYSASLDAAMGLVPEGYYPDGSFDRPSHVEVRDSEWGNLVSHASAATPSLALTAAALRAQAALSCPTPEKG